MRLAIKIAKSFLLSNKAQSVLIISAIAIGISVQLFIGLLIQGLQSDLIDSTIGDASHISITYGEETFQEEESIISTISEVQGIKKVSTLLVENAFMQKGDDSYSIAINGIVFDKDIYGIKNKLVEGSIPNSENEIVIGNFYEDIEVGDEVKFILSNGNSKVYEVVGKFDFGNSTINQKSVYTTLKSLQNFVDKPGEISAIETQVDEVFLSDEIAENIDLSDYSIVTWQDLNASLLSALSSQSMSSIIIQVFIVISVTLAISSVLIISVVQKSKQIGILKAMGLNNSSISKVFISQGFMLGAIGSILGIIIGMLLLYAFTVFAVDDIGNSVITITYKPSFIALSFLIGLSVSIIASFIPARKSHKLSAMEVIGNG